MVALTRKYKLTDPLLPHCQEPKDLFAFVLMSSTQLFTFSIWIHFLIKNTNPTSRNWICFSFNCPLWLESWKFLWFCNTELAAAAMISSLLRSVICFAFSPFLSFHQNQQHQRWSENNSKFQFFYALFITEIQHNPSNPWKSNLYPQSQSCLLIHFCLNLILWRRPISEPKPLQFSKSCKTHLDFYPFGIKSEQS